MSIIDRGILLPKVHLLQELNIGLRIVDVHIDKEQIGRKLRKNSRVIKQSVALGSKLVTAETSLTWFSTHDLEPVY